jgi:hypothetical protein
MTQSTRIAFLVSSVALAVATIGSGHVYGSQETHGKRSAVRAAAPEVMADYMADATLLHQRGRWSAAYGRFMRAADGGNVDAARIALTMYRYGPQLYRTQWDATTAQLETWSRMAGERPGTAAGSDGTLTSAR